MIIIEHLSDISRFKKIIFLDRDGVININKKNYLTSKKEIKLFKCTVKAMEYLQKNYIGIIIITNQQAIGKGIITTGEAIDIHLEILQKLNNSPVIASFICPHLATDKCECRKPGVKMIKTAQSLFNIDLNENYFIGDSLTDIEAAENSGLIPLHIGKKAIMPEKETEKELLHFNNLLDASKYIGSHKKFSSVSL